MARMRMTTHPSAETNEETSVSTVESVTRKRAYDRGEFATPIDAAAWAAGAVLAWPDAERYRVDICREPGRFDPVAPAGFMWRAPDAWIAEVQAEWPEEIRAESAPEPLDVTAVRDALETVRTEGRDVDTRRTT